jgi:hypothetical protein
MWDRSRTKSDAILPVPAMPQRFVIRRVNTPARDRRNNVCRAGSTSRTPAPDHPCVGTTQNQKLKADMQTMHDDWKFAGKSALSVGQ